jgi:ketopantoate reductase
VNYYLAQAPPQSDDALMLGERAFEQYGLLQSASQLRSLVGAKPPDTEARSKEQTVDVFISHSSQDVPIAKALVTLLRSALNLPSKSIRCTSVEGYMFDPGIPVDEQIRREVRQSTIFIGLITPASIRSPYVQFELGAR